MIVNRAAQGKLLRLGLRTVFGDTYDDIPLERDMLFETRSSDGAYEEDQNIYGTGWAALKPEGQSMSFDTVGEGWTARYVHQTYGLGLAITGEMMEDNRYRKWGGKAARSLARSLRLTQDVNAINIINRGTDSNYTGGDGVALFSTSHPLTGPGAGTYANTLDTQLDLSEEALEALYLRMRYAVDDRGLKINLRVKRLWASARLEFELERILKSTGRVGTNDNDTNALKSRGTFSGEPALLRHLTNDAAWGFTTTGHDGGLIHFDRRALRTRNDDDMKADIHYFMVDCRESNGWTDPRGVFGCLPV